MIFVLFCLSLAQINFLPYTCLTKSVSKVYDDKRFKYFFFFGNNVVAVGSTIGFLV